VFLGGVAPGVSAATLVVLNKAEATASLVDLDSGRVVATVPTGQGPHEVAVSPDGRFALATNYGAETPGSSVTLIDVAAARAVKTIDLGAYRRPHGVRWLDGRRALVTAEERKALLVLDVHAGRVEDAIITGQEVSHMVAVAAGGSRAFVSNIGSGTVTVVDLAARKVVESVATGKGAEGVDITPDGKQVWITNREADTVTVLDSTTLKTLATLPSKSFPIRARATPDGRHVLVSNARSGDLTVFDASSLSQVKRVAFEAEVVATEGRLLAGFGKSPVPIGVVVEPSGRRAYVALANADEIAILDLATWRQVGQLQAGREPDGMAYSTARVAGTGGGQ
jgi:YVTN family beta-propeller protein